MVLYNVTIKVEHDSAADWVKWMKEEHIPELMATGLFADAKLFQLREVDEEDGLTYAAQYFCSSMNEYNSYIENHAEAMRAKGLARFAGKFVAFRSVMETV